MTPNPPDQTLDDEVRSDPGQHTVEEVLDVLSRSDEAQIAAVKSIEADGKARSSIATYEKPLPAAAPDEPKFTVARLRAEGPRLTGLSVPVLAGALHGCDPAEEYTRDQVEAKAGAFLTRPANQES